MNKIEEKIYLINLYDIYFPLLSLSQKEAFHDYYCLDLSLKEISENRNVSRSAIEDLLKKGKHKLIEFEEKLHFYQKNMQSLDIIKEIKKENDINKIKSQLDLLERNLNNGI